MKKLIMLTILFASNAAYSVCGTPANTNETITRVQNHHDGIIFVHFSAHRACPCTNDERLAIRPSTPNAEFMKSMILAAYASGAPVRASSQNNSCPIHGNTAELTRLDLR